MANTLNLGTDGNWAVKKDSLLAYNSENNNFKPLPFDFSRASSATRVNKAGLIETVGSGEPRIDFKDNTKGALLLEPSRTNLIDVSTDFSQASLSKGTVTTNNAISPDGTLDADTFICNTVSATCQFVTSGTTGLSYTSSIYVKRKTGNSQVSLRGVNNISTPIDVTNQWKRFAITQTSDNGTLRCGVLLSAIGDEVYVWGAQTEQGSYATSYIPTSGSAVTRIADVCNNGANEQVIGQTEGVFYVDLKKGFTPSAFEYISLSDGTTSNTIRIFFNTSNQIGIVVGDGGVTQVNSTYSNVYLESENLKVAFKYKQNDFALWVNGQEVITDNSGTVPNVNYLNFGRGDTSTTWYEKTKEIKLYNTALTDQELIALTTI